jgi:glutathione S-transferase
MLVRSDYGVSEESAARAREAVVAAMDRVERELQPSGYLVGDRFSVADLTAASLFTPVLAPPERPFAPKTLAPAVQELRDELSARPGGGWVAQMYARHRGAPVAEEAHAVTG